MKSHEYKLAWRDLAQCVVPTLFILACVSVLLQAGYHFALLPRPPSGIDADSAVIRHQSQACRAPSPAELLLVGDSTCLVGVDARELSRRLPGQPPVLSLALYVWFSLEVYGQEIADFAAAHPGQVHTVVLLVTPGKLFTAPAQGSGALWRSAHHPERAEDVYGSPSAYGDWLGGWLVRRCFFSHLLAVPLNGSGADYYGFASATEAYLTAHKGSLANPGDFVFRTGPAEGPQERSITPEFEAESRAFRAMLPAGIRLVAGFTPRPSSHPSFQERAQRAQFLARWNESLRADALLTNLPPTLPPAFFGGDVHLNPYGQKRFTEIVARELAAALPPDVPKVP